MKSNYRTATISNESLLDILQLVDTAAQSTFSTTLDRLQLAIIRGMRREGRCCRVTLDLEQQAALWYIMADYRAFLVANEPQDIVDEWSTLMSNIFS